MSPAYARTSAILAALSWIFLVGCAGIQKDWHAARTLDTFNSYSDFLENHANSKFADSASSRIEGFESARNSENSRRIALLKTYVQNETTEADFLEDKWSRSEVEWRRVGILSSSVDRASSKSEYVIGTASIPRDNPLGAEMADKVDKLFRTFSGDAITASVTDKCKYGPGVARPICTLIFIKGILESVRWETN